MKTTNDKIEYINAHGTSTPVGDTAELGAVKNVFGDSLPFISSTKSLTGHSLGASMATILAGELGNTSKVRLYTFGSPRTGDEAFANWVVQRVTSMGGTSTRVRRQLDIVPAIPPRGIGYHHVSTEVWDKHVNDHTDTFVICNGSGEDPKCGDSEEHPPFPLDLIHLKPSEHTRYLGFEGGSCIGGPS